MSARVLVLNAGSSSLKFSLFEADQAQPLLEGLAERLASPEANLTWALPGQDKTREPLPGLDHHQAIARVFALLQARQLQQGLIAIGHRVVHGGEFFRQPVLITPAVIEQIQACAPLAPLHNPANLIGIHAAMAACADLPQVAVFDTAYHQTMPPRAYRYALPGELYRQHAVRRYGFHGTSHQYVSAEAARRLGLALADSGIIVAHLGNGCSLCAVANGESVDTSMGLTPLEGLVMGTRSGDLDAGILAYLQGRLGLSLDELLELLNKRSGLLGLSGISNDMRQLCELAEAGDPQASLAIEVFCYRLAKYIAAYTVALPRVDAIAFTGGIGENARPIRARVAQLLANLGVRLAPALNQANGDAQGRISSGDSRIALLVVPTREEWMIARQTLACLPTSGDNPTGANRDGTNREGAGQ